MLLTMESGRMKVLFLDVDGVLNKHSSYTTISDIGGGLKLDLDALIHDTKCKIVLSSTWRILEDTYNFISKHVEIFDVTDQDRGCRGDQIQRWLNKHPEVTNYAIVDDDSDMLDSQLRYYVHTEFEYGLTDNAAYRIEYILNNDIPERIFIGEAS